MDKPHRPGKLPTTALSSLLDIIYVLDLTRLAAVFDRQPIRLCDRDFGLWAVCPACVDPLGTVQAARCGGGEVVVGQVAAQD